LHFWHRYETEQYRDYCRVEISTNGGSTWAQMRYFYGNQLSWTPVSIDISNYIPNSDIRIRFRFTSNESNNFDGWYIDDVRIHSDETDWAVSEDGKASHTYEQSGLFEAQLRITDANDFQKIDTIDIHVDPSFFPEVTADATPKAGDTPLTVTFTGSAADSDGGTIEKYAWNFGEDYVWVADTNNNQVARLCQDGTCEMARTGGVNSPYDVSISPADGTVWVADYYNNAVVRLSANGQTELVRVGGFYRPASVSVNPADSSVWVADLYNNQVVNLSPDGKELVRTGGFYRPQGVAVNAADGTVWVADTDNHQVVKLSAGGSGLVRVSGFNYPLSIAVNHQTGTIWVANTSGDTVVRLAPDVRDGYHIGDDTGSHLEFNGFDDPYSVSADTSDDSVWIADYGKHAVVHLASDGTEVSRTTGFNYPNGVVVDSAGEKIWVADYYNNQVALLSGSGRVLTRLSGFNRPRAIAVADTGDRNVYTSDTPGDTTHTYTMPGIYHAVFTATDNDGNEASRSMEIAALGAPEVVVEANTTRGFAPLEVYLNAQVTELSGTVISYEWDLDGDGSYDTLSRTSPETRHVFSNAGTYNATFRVTTDIGYVTTDSITITVEMASPVAHVAAFPASGNAPLTVNFSGSGTDADGTITQFEWDFDGDDNFDETSTNSGTASHIYTAAGTHIATVRVTDNDGLTDTDTVTVTASEASTPSALLYIPADTRAYAPYNTRFYVHGIDPDGTIDKIEIDYTGDGTFETVQPSAFGDNMETRSQYWTAEGTWARTLTDAYSPSWSWTDSPDGNYPDNADMSLISATIDLSSATVPKLIFRHKYDLRSYDYGRVEISGDDGGSWSSLKTFHNGTLSHWTREEIDLSSYAGNATVKIRFRLTSNASDNADGWYIDDVWVGDTIEHTYTVHGNYSVTLRVTDNQGNTSVTTRDISVVAPENEAGIWVADYYNNRVVKLSDMGDIQVRVNGFNRPPALEVNPVTGNVWVADSNNNRIIKLDKHVTDGYDVSLSSFAVDDSTNGNPGGIIGDTVLIDTGQLNGGYDFDGSGDYIQIPDNPVYRMDAWTFEAWIKPENLSGNRTVVGKVSQGKDFALMMTGDKISVLIHDATRRYVTSNDPLTMGQWYHVAGVYDPSSGMVRLYVDGVLKQEAEWTPDTSNTDPLMIGKSNCCSEYFYGTIDDVRVWNTARSETQIADARNSELTGNEPGLVGYWKLNTVSSFLFHQETTGFNAPYGLSLNTADNTVWVADKSNHQVVHLNSDGSQIKRILGFYNPSDIAVNSGDGTVWVSDTSNNRIVKLLPDVADGLIISATGLTTDSTPHAHSGMLMGDVVSDAGKLNDCMWFDGNGDYIVIPPAPSLDVQNFTIEAWIKGDNVTDRTLFMRGNNAGENELFFGFKDATTIQAILDNDQTVTFTGEINFTDGEWRHIALVYDSSLLTCYVDGVVYGTPTAIDATLEFEDSQALIGADFDRFNSYLGNYFNGHIDDVRLWNTARTQTQINDNKDTELNGSEAGLAGYWKLNEVSDTHHRVFSGFNSPFGLSIDRSDNGVWVADYNNNQVVKLAEDGSQIHRKSGYNRPYRLAVTPNDRSVWVGDYENDRMVKLRPDGEEIAWVWGFDNPRGVAVNPDDATVWVADERKNQVVKLSPDGTELLRIDGFYYPYAISIDPATRHLSDPPQATADATWSDDGEAPLDVTFTGTGNDNGSIAEYAWDFDGDGIYDFISTTTGNTTHSYTTAGTYAPVLRVTDNDGQMTYSSPGLIHTGPLTVRATAAPISGNAPLTVNLTGYVTGLASDRHITLYEWDFNGDGIFDFNSKLSPATSYKYTTGGDYRASIRVTDNLGSLAYGSVDIIVNKQAPTAQNYATPTTGNVPLKVYLDGRGSDSDGSIIRYEWDYDGDGIYDWFSTSDGRTYFTYKTPGTYEATLRVTDNDHMTALTTRTIAVTESQNPPMANATASVAKGPAPLAVTFNGTGTDSDGQIQRYEWDFQGDGVFEHSSADTGNALHTYEIPGIYSPRFRVTDADGLTATFDLSITVQDSNSPLARIHATPKTGATPLTVQFDPSESTDPDGSIVRYDWSFGSEPIWVADHYNDRVKRVRGYQPESLPISFNDPYRLSVNPDGTVWISDHVNNQIVKMSSDGQYEMVRSSGFNRPYGVCADPSDGGVWVADYNNHQVVKLKADGSERIRKDGFQYPTSVAVYHADGSVWVADHYNNQVVKLDADGSELVRISGFYRPFWVTVDQSDGNIWVADRSNNRVVKLAGNPPSGYHTDVALVTPDTLNGNHAMLFGNAAPADNGNLSQALALDGSGDYVLIPSDAFSDMDSFTVEAWIKSTSVNGKAVFMRGNATGGNEIYFGFYNGSTIDIHIDDGPVQRFPGATNFADDNWHHVAMTYNGTDQTLNCYADGVLYGTSTVPADANKADIRFEGSHALIGADFDTFNGSLGNYFYGQIDDVRVWEGVRTPAQINDNKDTALTGSESGLAGYWKLDDFLQTPYHMIRTGFNQPLHIAVNSKDNTAWVCDHYNNQMVKISSDGSRELLRVDGFYRPHEAVVNPVNGTVWVADYNNNQIVLLSDTGREIKRISGFNRPTSVALASFDPQPDISLTTDQSVTHIFPEIGEYMVSLTVTDTDKKSDTDTVAINAGTYPEALAIAYPTTGTAPLTVRFAANGHSPTGTIEYFRWDFDGNGTTDWETRISENKEYTYNQPGIYHASLTVTDNRGLTDTKQVVITVLASSNAPEVVIEADPKEGKPSLEVNFIGLARDADGTITTFEWDFDGDGTFDETSTQSATASHTYTDIGIYTARLRVTDNDGNRGIGTTRIKVKPEGAPSATASASVTHGPAALTVTFSGSVSDLDTIVNYEWDFDGDGTFDFGPYESADTAHVYTRPGSYTAVLRVTNDKGLTDTASVDILVTAGITASLSRESFDPYAAETIAIQSVLTAPAKVTVLITDRTGNTIRTLVKNDDRTPGFYSDAWDGKNDSGQIMDSGAYLYVIHYETGGKTYVYDLTNDISAEIDKITPEYPTAFNPFNADTNFFRYTLDRKSEITVYISPFTGGANDRIKTMLLRHPQKAGSYVLVWDGTDDNGNLVPAMSYVLAVFKWHLPENAIIVDARPVISDPLIKPAYLNPDARPYDQENHAVMTYTLSKKADVVFSIYDSFNYIVRTITMKDVPAGAGNTVIWDGKNTDGQYVTPGTYRTKLIATDANGNKSFDANALLIVFY
jgi:PKD repeat protein